MPPINSAYQNTRTGLISWLVVFVILFVVAAIFAIYYDVQYNHLDQTSKELSAKMASAVSDSDLASPEFVAITNARGQGSGTVMQKLIRQRGAEARTITGNDKQTYEKVNEEVLATLQDVDKDLKAKNVSVTLTPDNLLQNIRLLASQVSQSADAVAKAQADVKAANDRATQVTAERDKLLGEKDKQIAAVQAQLQDVQSQSAKYQESKNTSVADIEQSAKQAMQEQQRRADTLQSELSKAQVSFTSLEHQFNMLKDKLGRLRVNPNSALQRADGVITKVNLSSNRVFINIGNGESVTPGLTFEIYDKNKGLPKLTASELDPNGEPTLPAGKASIEVIKVMQGMSECQIIKSAPGQTIQEGDLIENLVYDPNTKYNFVVFGAFDLAHSGNPTPGDAEVVRNLITRWGGKVQDQVSVNTDFVILGEEPVLPSVTNDDKDNPLVQRRLEDAQKALDAYNDVKAQALKLGVPILDQNRFLYFIGYYDQAAR